jgi:type IV pilus assembly protein PilQ
MCLKAKVILYIGIIGVLLFPYLLFAKKINATEEMITLDFQDVNIQDAIHLLAKSLHQEVIIDQSIQGSIHLHFHQMPVRAAFNLLLDSKALAIWETGHTWLILPRSEMIRRKEEELKWHKTLEEATPLVTRVWQIHYAKAEDIALILQDAHFSFLTSRGHVRFDSRTNILCIQDQENHMQEIHALIQRLDIPVQQVLIEARLASIDHDFEHELGIHFGTHGSDSTSTETDSNKGLNVAILHLAEGSLLDMRLSALEQEGHGELISSPSLFTANQQTATIESGEEIPYQEVSRSGATGVAFKKAVLSLKVTPQVMPGNQVLLQLQVNQDKPSSHIILGVPAITMRQISTHILVKNGQTIVLGGIYESDYEKGEQRVPFLGKIPILGWLFSQSNAVEHKRELLIFVTPKVIAS